MAAPPRDKTPLRDLTGLICPLCRHHMAEELGPKLQHCPEHPNRVLVPAKALADADGDPFMGTVIAGRFAVLELLGAGSMGTVYRARQRPMGRDVALKIVRSERLADEQSRIRFQQEAKATSLLQSRHTVTVYDFGEVTGIAEQARNVAGSMFLAMELLDGESLGDRLKARGAVPADEAFRIVDDTLSSLQEAHEKGVIHRDLKPDNLLLTRSIDGTPICKVLDFGIAKMIRPDASMDAIETQAGTVFGTPRYMSPEQAQGKSLDARSDIYSLGVILYHMLTGQAPFTDKDAVVVMAHHIRTVPTPPSKLLDDNQVPPEAEALLMRVLAKDPAERPQNASEFKALLANLDLGLRDTSPDQTHSAVAASVETLPLAARSWLWLAAGVLLLTVTAILLLSLRKDPGPRLEAGVTAAARPMLVELGRVRRELLQQQPQPSGSAKPAVSSEASATPVGAVSVSPSATSAPSASAPSPPTRKKGTSRAAKPKYQRWDRR